MEKNGAKKSKERRKEPHQFQTVAGVLASDWCQKTFVLFCPIRGQQSLKSFRVLLHGQYMKFNCSPCLSWRSVCTASVSVWFRSKERPRNGIFGFGRAPKPNGIACYAGKGEFCKCDEYCKSLVCRFRCSSTQSLFNTLTQLRTS